MEVADDMALAQMLKRSGARSLLVNGRGEVGLHFYKSLREMARGAEKSAAIFKFKALAAVAGALAVLGIELAPFICLAWPSTSVRATGAAALVVATLATVSLARWLNQGTLAALCWPLGTVLNVWMMGRAGVLGAMRSGIVWRGTHYPAKALLAGRRIQFP
jgi:hypothetical protein